MPISASGPTHEKGPGANRGLSHVRRASDEDALGVGLSPGLGLGRCRPLDRIQHQLLPIGVGPGIVVMAVLDIDDGRILRRLCKRYFRKTIRY